MDTKFINFLLDIGGDISMQYFRTAGLRVDKKSDDSPVSIADKQAEQAMRERIRRAYPEHGIIGEEFGVDNADAEYVWIIDPIDGTRAFIAGVDSFANMVCVLHNHRPILSGIGFPAREERYIAIDGVTYLNGTPVHSIPHRIADCALSYTGLYMYNATQLKAFAKLRAMTNGERVGGDAHNYCRLAAGDARIVCEADLQPYDFLPLVPILQNAGATISDWQGNPLHMHSSGEVIASPAHHTQIIEALQA